MRGFSPSSEFQRYTLNSFHLPLLSGLFQILPVFLEFRGNVSWTIGPSLNGAPRRATGYL